jgi:flagellar hook assembly protein FlgD
LKIRFVLAALLFLTAPAWAAFTSMDTQAPSARLAGLGGALEASPAGSEAALGNPAAFAQGQDATLSLSGGNGGSAADRVLAAWLAGPVQDDLSLGLAYLNTAGALGPGFSEEAFGLGAGLAAAPALSLGVRAWMLQASTAPGLLSSGRGFSMDAGARSEWKLGGRDSLTLGLSGSNLASEWPDRFWRRSVPLTTRAGLGWTRSQLAWVGLQFELADGAGPGLAPRQAYRLGIESLAFQSFQARLGASTLQDQAFSAGFSLPFEFPILKGTLHYALVLDQAAAFPRHRLQIDLSYRVRPSSEIYAVPLQVVFEPGTKKVKSARVSLNAEKPGEPGQEWELEIRDKNGQLIRVLHGTGIPPALVTWDGKDALGQAVEDGDQVSYRLNIKTSSGLRSSADHQATEASLSTEGLGALAIPADNGALVVPVMGQDGKASQLLLRPPTVPGETQHWEIVVQDDNGKTLKKLEGTGALPTELLWDGTDEKGQKVGERTGLHIRFNAFDKSGNVSSVEQGLDSGLQPVQAEGDEALPRLGLRMPAMREGGPSLEMRLSDSTLRPLAIPAELPPAASPVATVIPTTRPTAIPTRRPTAIPTSVPTPMPTAIPTLLPTAVPTAETEPKPQRTPETRAAVESRPLVAGLQAGRFLADPNALPPAIMTRAEAEARGPQTPSLAYRGPGRPSLRVSIDGVLDVFKPSSAEVDEAKYADKLQAFYWRLQGYKHRRLQLTGLVKLGEAGGESLSRERAREISRRMIEEGGFSGEFILRVDGKPGEEGGVRVEVLKR